MEPSRIAFAILIPLLLVLTGCFPPAAAVADPTHQPVAQSTPASAKPSGPASGAPSAPNDLLVKAQREQRNGDLVAARQDYRGAASGGPNSQEARLRLGEVEQASGEPESAREEWQRLVDSRPPEPLQSRARLLLARANLALGDDDAVLRGIDVQVAPDGLADFVVLKRAEAAAGMGNVDGATGELGRPELVGSTNRILLEQAGDLAERVGDPALAARYYSRSADYPSWTADRSRVMEAAAQAFEESGQDHEAIERYRSLMENYGWTKAAERAGERLIALGGLSYYHQGVLLGIQGDYEGARAAFEEAAAGGRYAAAAARQLRQMDEADAWRAAVDDGSPEAFHSFHISYPDSSLVAEARFREGMAHYEAGSPEQALTVWEASASEVSGDDKARMLFWSAKALEQLGQEAEARTRLEEASTVHPAGYYALRARDLLSGQRGWPGAKPGGAVGVAAEEADAEGWISGWAGPPDGRDVASDPRVRRGLGLAALGFYPEAEAEFNGLIDESNGGWFLFRLAKLLQQQEEWASASRAATRLIGLSPAGTVTEAPPALQRLVYPVAYPDLAKSEAARADLDPLLLLSLAYQESRFDPFALSLADARGLTQVVPPTGKGIASALERPSFAPEDLYRPAVSLEFGAWYLENQISEFGGDPFKGLAAYNAGAGPVPRWSADDPDLFLERIDYSETRSYVRQVYLHYAIYRALQ